MTDISSPTTKHPNRWTRDGFVISCDTGLLNHRWLTGVLAESYWAKSIPAETVQKAIDGSLCFGLYDENKDGSPQIGFARAISDQATFAWVADVFIAPPYRGNGLGDWLIHCMKSHPNLQGLRRWMLATRDAHGFYKKHGFVAADASRMMTIHDPDIYQEN